jgi:hypothetical protein
MSRARIVSGTGRDKTLTSGIFALIAQNGLDRITLRSGLNRPVAKFVASASKDGLRETALPILVPLFTNKSDELRAHTPEASMQRVLKDDTTTPSSELHLRFRFGRLGSTRTCVVFFAMYLPVRGRVEVWTIQRVSVKSSLDHFIRPVQAGLWKPNETGVPKTDDVLKSDVEPHAQTAPLAAPTGCHQNAQSV